MDADQHTSHIIGGPHGLEAAAGAVVTGRELKALGVPAETLAERCRPGGPWRRVLPGVYLLHPGAPSGEERVRAALLYAGRPPGAGGPADQGREALVTGRAALALHRFTTVPSLPDVPAIDILVPYQRRLRDSGGVRIHRTRELPRPFDVGGLPCAPVPRAVADALAGPPQEPPLEPESVRRLLTEAVLGGHCDPASLLRELAAAGLPDRPEVTAALPALREAGRRAAEQRLYTMVRCYGLPDPVWNVELRLPGGPPLGTVDAYWPEHAVAVAVDDRTGAADDDALWAPAAALRERLDALGITLAHLTPAELRDAIERQATVVRTALIDSADRGPAAYVVVTPH
ncbi:hypothetical protein [Streptomyces sp. NBC_01190]|uniref:hypothetical protein n=1 Tax=Streptomyces sp. NBC_01190 TaxID=2903767 RepID=UPI003870E199|nr:hypothetical protein OG519_10275 [Streptomyces sp. NBC_01190]